MQMSWVSRRLCESLSRSRSLIATPQLFQFARDRRRLYLKGAGWSSLVARQAHNLKVAGSNPAPATNFRRMAATYRVYILQNREARFYIGLSEDIARRIGQHNFGLSKWTRGKGPWKTVWKSESMNLSDARKVDSLVKKQKGGDGFYLL